MGRGINKTLTKLRANVQPWAGDPLVQDGIDSADFTAKNVPPARFLHAAHPLRVRIPPAIKNQPPPKGESRFYGAAGGMMLRQRELQKTKSKPSASGFDLERRSSGMSAL